MTLLNKNLLNLPVYTQSGLRLGYVTSFEIDELEQRIKRYSIKTHYGIAGLFDRQLIVSAEQVVRLSREKLVVEDTVLKQTSTNTADLPIKSTQPAGH
ncbi:MAG: PRC-barrel domain-containing protein [Patescibacteria group bacterium]|jgi:sporulation protein YlmC with PRC-barrel domain